MSGGGFEGAGMRRRRQKKGKSDLKRAFLVLILIGALIGFVYLFRQEIFHSTKPWLEKRGLVQAKREVTLFFSDQEAEYLIGEKRQIRKGEDTEEGPKQLLKELIKGPRGKLLPTLPSRTRVLSIDIDEKGTATVNFDRTLTRDHPGGSSAEMMTVYSVVNSLTFNFPEIKKVQFVVEGKEIESLTGHLSLSQSISPKPDLLRKTASQSHLPKKR